jgi:hypothetical protein
MLFSGKKFRALRDKKNILTLVLSEKKILNETKNHNPPPSSQMVGSLLKMLVMTAHKCNDCSNILKVHVYVFMVWYIVTKLNFGQIVESFFV